MLSIAAVAWLSPEEVGQGHVKSIKLYSWWWLSRKSSPSSDQGRVLGG